MGMTPFASDDLPGADGDRRLYLWPELRGKVPDSLIRKVIYVNGMCTTPHTHRTTCWLLSEITESYVLGVYNLTGRTGLPQAAGLTDFVQCLLDKAGLAELVVQKSYAEVTRLPSEERRVYMRRCLSLNLATQSLFDQLVAEMGTGRQVVIVCHSQGNLIVSNAIHAASWVHGGPLHFIRVFALASPAMFWPGGANVQFYTNADDAVPLASLGLSRFRDQKWTRVSDADPDFIVPDLWMNAHNVVQYLYQRDFIESIRKVLRVSGTFPAAPPAVHGGPAGQLRNYVVKSGDTLSEIAQRFYGNSRLASRIYDANRGVLRDNPDLIRPGQQLVIP